MPRSRPLREDRFVRLGFRKPVTRGEASSTIDGIGGDEGGTLDRVLQRVLGPYWQDPTRPVHLDKDGPASPQELETLLMEPPER